MPSRRTKTRPCLAAALAAALVVGAHSIPAAGQSGGDDGGGRPNFLVVVTDDQSLEQMRALPKTERFVGRKGGTTFTDAIVTTPHCCPSRVTLLTGQYAHNHGVLSNKHGYLALEDPENVLPVWLQRAGYATAHLGKFLNGYEKAPGPITEVAPGWDEWATLLKPRRYLDYDLQVNGKSVPYGEGRKAYLTNVLTDRARRLIRRLGSADDPFYVQLDHYAPHAGAGDPSGDCGESTGAERSGIRRYQRKPLPKTEAFDERDVSDKPVFLQRRDRLAPRRKLDIRDAYRCALASLESVDRGVKELVLELEDSGALEETVVIFTSDNGYFYGEHRIPGSKTLPYEGAIHVPLLIRLPRELRGAERVRAVRELVANVDLAPTILDLADAEPCSADRCRIMDGRSLVPLLRGRDRFPDDRAVAVELTQAKDRVKPTLSCSYRGLRTKWALYVEHTSVPRPRDRRCRDAREVERYDLRADPFELENLGPSATLSGRLARVRTCAGIEGRDPVPGSGAYCE